ncbi:Ig-like domain-containing protein [Marinobacterium rhizophilum]|uniref:DUF4347 domain-containing protein n=1 Tax=Marinobacterium rhizophilum TaxID=420402 RepID=A0ABY5HMF6_9GAMM|nr:Ig-like domain-containing protein [Marinobacterium rhizophilum]UTW13139.1 DUF4347 domain-containing protein [Marinobacterium rhizophilum]
MKWFGWSGKGAAEPRETGPGAAIPPLAMALEPRMMFDGAIAATVADTPDSSGEPATIQQPSASPDADLAAVAGSSDHRQEVVFVDTQVQDYQQLLSGLPEGVEVILFDGAADGLQVIADSLAGREGIDAIHILSHGDNGQLQLGSDWLDSADIANRSDLLAAIGQSLSAEGDILLYGCTVGGDAAGIEFIESLASATGADIAASSDLTGAADRGGDWVLEASTGSIESASLDLTDYSGLLTAFSDSLDSNVGLVTSFNSTLGGVSFTYTFTTEGGGGDMLWLSSGGESNSASMNLLSGDFNFGTTERVTIARTDAADFTFSSLYINNTAGDTITVGGYLDGVLVGSAQTIIVGASGTLSFGALGVDEVRITSADFGGISIDSFTGDTNPPAPPAPTITSATYDASTGVLAVTGTNITTGDNIDASTLTLTGEGGSTYTLTDTINVIAGSASSFSMTLSAADRAALNQIFNKNGTSSTGGTTFNLAAADDWNLNATSGDTSDATNAVTVSSVAAPTISNATYDVSTGTMVVSGTGFLSFNGASNDIDASKFTLIGEGGATYTLTDTSNVEISSGTSFTLTLSATDKAAINLIANKNGTSSTSGTTFNLAAAEDWAAGADASVAVADLTGNGITVSNVAVPTISSATYDAGTGTMTVTGTGFLSLNGASNDIDASKFTLTGEGGATYTLTDTSNVEISSGTSFTLVLSATDKAAINLIANKNGTSSTSGTTFNLAAAEDWAAGADASVAVADLTGNGITVSSVAVPTITSATYDAGTGTMVVSGTGFLSLNGASNDIDASKFTLTGEGGATYTLTDTSNVEISTGTSFTLTLSATDKAAINLIANKNGTSSTSGTTFNLAAAEDWAAGADASVAVADLTGNGITVSNVAVPTISSATYDAGTGTMTVTGTGFLSLSGASNDIDASKFTLTGEGGATYTLTDSSDVEINSGTSFTLVLSATDLAAANSIMNNNGTSATDNTTYNLAAAEDWAAGADTAVIIADPSGNGVTVSNVADTTPPTTTSIVVADTALAAGETSLVTITFSEAVTGLAGDDFTVANATLSNLATADGGISWTATLTPTADIEDTSNLVTLDNSGVQDLAGNAGSGSTDSNNYAIDTLRPTASIVVADTALAAGETSLVTVTFNEAVTGLSTADFSVANGALSSLSTADGGISWTATLTRWRRIPRTHSARRRRDLPGHRHF